MSHYRVAIIDDSPDDSALLKRLLSKDVDNHYDVAIFNDPNQGLEAVLQATYDIYFIDFNLGGMTAIDILKAASERHFRKPTVVITGSNDPSVDFQVLQAGATEFMNKDEMTARLVARTIRHGILRKQNELALEHKANHDRLTNLANKHHFMSELDRAIARHYRADQRFAILMVDLDNFKPVNDEWGHAAGDHLLLAIAKELRLNVRGGDLVGRLGGDEFAVLLESVQSSDEAGEISRILEERIRRPIKWRGNLINVGASIGHAFYPDDAADSATLLEIADQSMYQAKGAKKRAVSHAQ